jgi:hypothetical protein
MSALGEPISGRSHFEWSPIFGGAAIAAGVSFTLHAFGSGIGLSLASAAPTWRDSSAAYWLLAGAYLLFVAIIAFAVGGYVTGRMRDPLTLDPPEMEFRDGMHGLATWGVAIVLTALLALGAAAIGTSGVAPSGANAGASQSVAGENIIASELDELFRTTRTVDNLTYRRAEAARILLKASSHNGVPSADRQYLTRLAGAVIGLSEIEAQARVDRAITTSGQELRRARVAAVIQAFFIAAALLVGAVIAWATACEGGKEREQGVFHFWEWSARRRT